MIRKTRGVTRERIPVIATALREKAKTPNTVTLEEMVWELAKPIQEMLDAGYSYEDVAALFADHGAQIAASSIKTYHRKQKAQQPDATMVTSDVKRPAPVAESDSSPVAEDLSDSKPSPSRLKREKSPKSRTESTFNVTNRDEL